MNRTAVPHCTSALGLLLFCYFSILIVYHCALYLWNVIYTTCTWTLSYPLGERSRVSVEGGREGSVEGGMRGREGERESGDDDCNAQAHKAFLPHGGLLHVPTFCHVSHHILPQVPSHSATCPITFCHMSRHILPHDLSHSAT